MAWRIKCPPARPRIGKRSRGGGSPSLGIRYPRGWRRPLRPRGRRRLAAGGPPPPAAKQKAGAGGFAPAPAFQGALRPAAAPLRRPRRGPLSAGNVADAPKKGEVPAKALPPVMAVSPIYPPLGMLPMACRYASTSSRKPSMPSRSETRSSPRPMCFIR